MKANNFFKFIISVSLTFSAGFIGSFFTASAIPGWYAELTKPALNPPNWVFGPVWTALYFILGLSLFIVWRKNFSVENKILSGGKKTWNLWSEKLWSGNWQKANTVSIFFVQLILNALWSPVFFGFKNPALALFIILSLWMAIFYTIINFYRTSKTAAWLLLPYILWVSFATYLNFMILILN